MAMEEHQKDGVSLNASGSGPWRRAAGAPRSRGAEPVGLASETHSNCVYHVALLQNELQRSLPLSGQESTSLSLHPSSAAEMGFRLAVHRGPGQVGLAATRGPPRAPRAGRPEPPRFQISNSRLAILCFSNQMWYNHLTSLAP